MLQLVFFVPESHKESVKKAVFEAGAGRYESYDYCAWEVLGTGQFKPLVGSKPHVGKQDTIELVAEYRIEMICERQYIQAVIEALLAAHPYEEPAYTVTSVLTLADLEAN